MGEDTPVKRAGLTLEQAQKMLDYVADRLSGADHATAERLLEEFVDRMRGLNDIASIKRLIEQGDDEALKHLGGVEGARGMIHLVEKIGRE
jgi:DNA-binding phage protein